MEIEKVDVVAAKSNPESIIAETKKESPVTKMPKVGSRADLLRQAWVIGIRKYAYILSKAELKQALATHNPMVWKEILDKAKARRKIGG